MQWICGFANANGGSLYVGVDDNGQIIGVANAKRLLEDLPNKIRDTMGIVADINLLKLTGVEPVPPVSVPFWHFSPFSS